MYPTMILMACLNISQGAVVIERVPSSYVGGVKWVLYNSVPGQTSKVSSVNQASAAALLPVHLRNDLIHRSAVVNVDASPVNTKKITIYKSKVSGMKSKEDHDTEVIESLTGVPDLLPPYYDYEQNYYTDYQDVKRPQQIARRVFKVPEDAVEVSSH